MSLNLYVNNERYSNSSMFYRLTSNTSTFTVRLSDLSIPNAALTTIYYVQSSINTQPFTRMQSNESGCFEFPLTFNTSVPCICSINVSVSSLFNESTIGEFVSSFSMSAAFVKEFPIAEFIAYPSLYIDETTKQLSSLNGANYNLSPGTYFYGEGHTEIVNLSANNSSLNVANWFVGNAADGVSIQQTTLPISSTNYNTSIVAVSTTLNDERSYPISLWLTNGTITTSGPFVTYDDAAGLKSYYPFFTSTITVDGGELKELLKGNIQVKQYPNNKQFLLLSPFSSSEGTILPFDHSPESFLSKFYKNSTSFLTEKFKGSQWNLKANSYSGSWNTTTTYMSAVTGYQFNLSYDTSDVFLPTFKASELFPTTITLNVSSVVEKLIDYAPHDWLAKNVTFVDSVNTTITQLPVPKIYTPNYYNLKNEAVTLTIVEDPNIKPYSIRSLRIDSDYADQSIFLNSTPLTGSDGSLIYSLSGQTVSMIFNKIGAVDLRLEIHLYDPDSVTQPVINANLTNFFEVVNSLDASTNEKYFRTKSTPLQLTYDTKPKLTPNEWAIADNVNSVVEHLYKTVDELTSYTNLYDSKNKFYGWFGSKSLTNVIEEPISGGTGSTVQTVNKIFLWQDLDCLKSANEITSTWAYFEGLSSTCSTWDRQTYDTAANISQGTTSTSCLQKHCIQWKWRNRKSINSTNIVTWKQTKSNGEYAKKWKFEECSSVNRVQNCIRDSWRISNIDLDKFSITPVVSHCSLVDIKIHPITNDIIVATPFKIAVIDNSYYLPTKLEVVYDENSDTIPFQNITKIDLTSDGKLVVLDNIIPKVYVFKLNGDSFSTFSLWGDNGRAGDPLGFNAPLDLHIDAKNTIWIADTGNFCVKRITVLGNHLLTFTHEIFNTNPPISICLDSKLNVHCLTQTGIEVFSENGIHLYSYNFPSTVVNPIKLNVSYNKEIIYLTHEQGIEKFFRNGEFFESFVSGLTTSEGNVLTNYNSATQDKYRNVFAIVEDKVLKISDLQQIVESKAHIPSELYWPLDSLKIHKEEYIQPWVYLKSFHRLWDNVELLRNSLYYDLSGCKTYVPPVFAKTDLIIGQNEIVSNSVINRIAEQIWTNIQTLFDYFDPTCEK